MIQELTMRNFKSFAMQRGTIRFGGLSLIIGTNASGKSNIRDGLRFIHGISRGYSIAEIIGEKYVEGGVLQWKGIRGGVKETVLRNGNPTDSKFTIEVKTKLSDDDGGGQATYSITVDVGDKSRVPTVVHEELKIGTRQTLLWKEISGPGQMSVYLRRESVRKSIGPAFSMRNDRPALTQIQELDSMLDKDVIGTAQKECKAFLKTISSVRFLDLEPQALRRPSIPGKPSSATKARTCHRSCKQFVLMQSRRKR